jgi:hypothetical protein
MQATKNFRDLVQSRVASDPNFASALLREGINTMLTGDVDTGKAILRDYIKATVCLVAKSFARRSARTGPTAEAAESPTSGAPLRPVGL